MNKLYVVYVLPGGRTETHGGPYTPMKAREVRESMEMHVENGNHSDWSIPEDTVDVITSPVVPWRVINGHRIHRKPSRGVAIFECINPECQVRSNTDYGWNRTKEHLEEKECPAENRHWIGDFIAGP